MGSTLHYIAMVQFGLLTYFLDARRYFKQSEIILFRQAPDGLPENNAGGLQPLPAPNEAKLAAAQAAAAQG